MDHEAAKDLSFGTKAIHAGVEPEPVTGAIMTPMWDAVLGQGVERTAALAAVAADVPLRQDSESNPRGIGSQHRGARERFARHRVFFRPRGHRGGGEATVRGRPRGE